MSYERSASVYDAIYTGSKNYEDEAERLHRLINRIKMSPGKRLLDVACGTGLHDQYLCKWFRVDGIDLSPAQLEVARARHLPGVRYLEGDMRDYELSRKYDAIVNLFSAVGHLPDVAALNQTVATAAQHLLPGGVLVIEPWLQPEKWQEGHRGYDIVDTPELKVARLSQSRCVGNLIYLDMHHLVSRPDHDIEYFVDHHRLMMFTVDEFRDAFETTGLEFWHEPTGINDNGRGIFIGRKPPQ